MLSKGRRNDFRKYFISLFYSFCLIVCSNQNAEAALPVPWVNQGIGGQVQGSADFANNQFTLNSAGIDIGGSFDTFHYIYQLYTGDVELIAKVESIGNSNNLAKAGVMIRETLTTGSKNAFMALTYGSTSLFQRRTLTNGGTSSTSGTNVRAPYWVKLTRQGNTFKAYQSADGVAWTQVGTSVNITMGANVYVGLAATSKNLTTLNTNVFSNVSVRPATASAAPVLNSATGGPGQVDLTWNASSTATSYKVKYGTVSGSYTTTLTLSNITSTSVTGLTNGTNYYFVVTAVNEYGESVVSNQLSATPLDPPTVFINKIDYNAMGQKTRIEYGNGVITTNTYDPLNLRLKRIYSVNALGTVLQDLSYTYDSAGNILSITDALNTASQTFQYDALNRLTQAVGSSYGTKNYVYDPIGNIVQKDGKIYSYAAGGAGVHAVTSLSDGTTMTYDANGNMASKQKGTDLTLFTYDTENRLLEIKKNNVITASYAYDGDGGRVKKTVGSTVTRYVGSLYEETNGVKTRHVFVGDMKVVSITGAQQMYYLTDHLGGTNIITDKLGVKKELTEYEPYGQFSRRDKYGTGAEVANFYFTGQRFDEESGLYYYNARYYDPGLGRFITADTKVTHPNDPQDLNRYSYTSNNPVNRIDPTGHGWLKNIFKSFNKAFDKFVGWLENVTNSSWSIDAEFGQSHQFQDAQTLAKGTREVGLAIVTQPWQIGVGAYRWASHPEIDIINSVKSGNITNLSTASIEDNDNLFINGILNSKASAVRNGRMAFKQKAFKVAYNPTDGALADVTEAFLQKLTFTSSFDRKLAGMLDGHKGITLAAHSQGAIALSNTLLNLGLRGQRSVIERASFHNTQISRSRAYLTGAMAGLNVKHVSYGSRYFDPSNVGAPNLTEPLKFLSGIPGLYLPFGTQHHGIE